MISEYQLLVTVISEFINDQITAVLNGLTAVGTLIAQETEATQNGCRFSQKGVMKFHKIRLLFQVCLLAALIPLANLSAQTYTDRIGCSFRGQSLTFVFDRQLRLGQEIGRYGAGLFDCQFWVVEGVTLREITPNPIQTYALMKPEGSTAALTLQPYYAHGAMLVATRPLPAGVTARNFANSLQGFSTNFSTGVSEWIDPDFRANLSLILPITLASGDRVQKVVNNYLPNSTGTLQPLQLDSVGDHPMFLMAGLLTVVSSSHIPDPDALAPAVVGPTSLTAHNITLRSIDRWLSRATAWLWSQSDYQNRVRGMMAYGERMIADNIRDAFIQPVKHSLPHWTDSQTIPLSMGINSASFSRQVSYGREFASAAGAAYVAALFRADLSYPERLALIARLVQLAIQDGGVWIRSYELGVRSQNMLLGGKSQGFGLNMLLAGLITGTPELARIFTEYPGMAIAEAQVGALNSSGVRCGRRAPDTLEANYDCDFSTTQLPAAQDAHYPRDTLRSVSSMYVLVETMGFGQLLPDSFRKVTSKFIDQSMSNAAAFTKPPAEVMDYWWLVKRISHIPGWE